jgi:hypothetical protein
MSIFKDATYEDMDWIAKVTEPLQSPLNETLSLLPEEIILAEETIARLFSNSRIDVSHYLNNSHHSYRDMSWEARGRIDKCFKVEVENNTTIDFRTEPPTVTGGIRIIKTISSFEEKELTKLLGDEAIARIRNTRKRCANFFPRANEIAEIFECGPEVFRTRSPYKKVAGIANRYAELLVTNKWRIRDDKLASSVGSWVRSYIEKGDLSALANICKLKVMTYSGDPIYSIEETV